MTKFKFNETAILKATGKEVIINKTITDFGVMATKYKLKTGEEVTDKDLLKLSEAEKVVNVLHKSTKKGKTNIKKLAKDIEKVADKKSGLHPVENLDQVNSNQGVEKSDFEAKNN